MLTYLLIPWFGLMSLINGRDWLGQGYVLALAPSILFLFLPWEYVIIFYLGYALYNIPGWGSGLVALHGNKNFDHGHELVYDLITKHISEPFLQGICSMGLRSLYLLPFFITVGCFEKSMVIPTLGLLMLIQGFIYYLSGRIFNINEISLPATIGQAMTLSEIMSGALIGLLLVILVKGFTLNGFI